MVSFAFNTTPAGPMVGRFMTKVSGRPFDLFVVVPSGGVAFAFVCAFTPALPAVFLAGGVVPPPGPFFFCGLVDVGDGWRALFMACARVVDLPLLLGLFLELTIIRGLSSFSSPGVGVVAALTLTTRPPFRRG